MKKVININFQGRVIPIEETAYESLKQYIDSLRRFFANEDGRDEIINDIEGRIAELFSERLKKGTVCITDEDVNAVIAGMGRPEELEAAEVELNTINEGARNGNSERKSGSNEQTWGQNTGTNYQFTGSGRLYRNVDDKIIGGVASGLANYFKIDPIFMRILFVVLFGALFWVYILLWIIVPSKSMQTNITKRLYRSAEDKVIGGVCGGLAAYFNIDTWIPRLIFALPLIVAIVSGPFNFWFNDWDIWMGPRIISGSLSSTLFVAYIILWIAVPVAYTAAEKLEMKGERIDLNSISKTVKEDLESFKTKAEKWGHEVKESAQQFGEKAKDLGATAGHTAKQYAAEAGPVARSAGSGIGHAIGILFKAFFLFIAGSIALALFGVLIGLMFGGFIIFPLKDFFLQGFWQNALAWLSLVLFLGLPIVALITWLVRRIMGVRSKRHYLGFIFGSLWVIGLISLITLAGMMTRNFKSRSAVEDAVSIAQPANNKLYVDVARSNVHYYGNDWFDLDHDENWPMYGINQDTLMLNTVRVNVVKSKDGEYHITKLRLSRGNTPEIARTLAERISFDVQQKDSLILLPQGFPVSREDRFRNQQVLIVIEVPVGKRIQLDRGIEDYDYFTINYNRRKGLNVEFREEFNNTFLWDGGIDYTMTPEEGLVKTASLDKDELKNGRYKVIEEKVGEEETKPAPAENNNNNDSKGSEYRYKGADSSDQKKSITDTVTATKTAYLPAEADVEETEVYSHDKSTSGLMKTVYVFGRLFQQ